MGHRVSNAETMTILEHPCSKDIRKLYSSTSIKKGVARLVRVRNRRDQLNTIKNLDYKSWG